VTAMNCSGDDVLRLPAVLDLAASEDFLGTVHQHLQASPALRLDASAVETLTLPCIQIILAGIATQRVSVFGASEAFASAFRDLALDWRTNGEADGEAAADLGARVEPAPEAAAAPAAEFAPAPAPEPMAEPAPAIAPEPAIEPAPALANEPADEAAPQLMAAPAALPIPGAEPMPIQPPSADPVAPPDANQSIEQSSSQSDETDGAVMAKRILTIDDSKTMRDMLMLTLAEAGFEVLQAVDGQDGLDVLGQQRVDVVITDINMPIMDGYGVIRNLRKDPVHKTTPILVLTTESDAEKKVIAREAGATGWMVKPFDPDRLIATIRKVAP
jgi:two-component system chemotaxis response regulator CheY